MLIVAIELDRVDLDPTDSHITYTSKPNDDQDYAPDIQVRILRERLPETLPNIITVEVYT